MTSPADSPPPSTGFLIWHVSLKWRVALDRALAPLGLTSAQYAVLASLYGLSRTGAQPSQRQLADFSGLEPMYVSKLARALERAGLLERAANPADPRAVRLTLTERGVAVVVAAMATQRALEEQRLAPLGGAGSPRSIELRVMLQALLRQAEQMEGACPPGPADRDAAAPAGQEDHQ